MSMSHHLQSKVNQLRSLLKRGNGDIFECGPALLDELEAEIERVRGLELVAPINEDLFNELNRKLFLK